MIWGRVVNPPDFLRHVSVHTCFVSYYFTSLPVLHTLLACLHIYMPCYCLLLKSSHNIALCSLPHVNLTRCCWSLYYMTTRTEVCWKEVQTNEPRGKKLTRLLKLVWRPSWLQRAPRGGASQCVREGRKVDIILRKEFLRVISSSGLRLWPGIAKSSKAPLKSSSSLLSQILGVKLHEFAG